MTVYFGDRLMKGNCNYLVNQLYYMLIWQNDLFVGGSYGKYFEITGRN